jgi:ankyrin repeat protein
MKGFVPIVLAASLSLAGCPGTKPVADEGPMPAVKTPVSPANEQLILACTTGKLKDVQDALAAGGDPNGFSAKNRYHSPALTVAVAWPEVVQVLLKAGASPAKADMAGVQPLLIAAGSGALKSVELLVDAGAVVDAKAKDGSTPLLVAAREGRLDVAKFLIAHGANVNAADGSSHTALFNVVTTQRGKPEDRMNLIRLLVSRGADVSIKEKSGRMPVDFARINLANAMGTNPELISLLTPKKK